MRKPNQKPLIFLIFKALTLVFLITGCSSLKRTLNQRMDHASFQHSLHGLVVVDANTGEEIYAVNGDIYFTPASNTKIVTFYTGLQLLPKNIPSFRYVVANDTVFSRGRATPLGCTPFLRTAQPSVGSKNKEIWPCLRKTIKRIDMVQVGPGRITTPIFPRKSRLCRFMGTWSRFSTTRGWRFPQQISKVISS